jgi:hypothetical protein
MPGAANNMMTRSSCKAGEGLAGFIWYLPVILYFF